MKKSKARPAPWPIYPSFAPIREGSDNKLSLRMAATGHRVGVRAVSWAGFRWRIETGIALGVALAAFSIGVEIGHQLVVIPLFVILGVLRKSKTAQEPALLDIRILKLGSAAISLAGIYFLIQAIR